MRYLALRRRSGLSPRGRGKLRNRRPLNQARRSIPAWAGETLRGRCLGKWTGVYPRVGGGNGFRKACWYINGGLSPRGRGKPDSMTPTEKMARSIPAWAGETMAISTTRHMPPVYPRVGGGNQHEYIITASKGGLSPRGRGKRARSSPALAAARSIPAWAGETCPSAAAS